MKINLLCIGKTEQKEIQSLIQYYIQRLPKYWNFNLIEIPEIKNAKNLSINEIKNKETELLLSKIQNSDYIILLDEKGKNYTSREFSEKIKNYSNHTIKNIVFIIGGAYGFSEKMYQKAQEKLSLSSMTFTHQMIRLFFIEQLYRSAQIIENKPYHND